MKRNHQQERNAVDAKAQKKTGQEDSKDWAAQHKKAWYMYSSSARENITLFPAKGGKRHRERDNGSTLGEIEARRRVIGTGQAHYLLPEGLANSGQGLMSGVQLPRGHGSQ